MVAFDEVHPTMRRRVRCEGKAECGNLGKMDGMMGK